MSGGLIKKYYDLLGRFTYRQRFVYFGFIFFLFIPPPLYIVLQATNLFYKSKRIEHIGILYQKDAGGLLNVLLQDGILKSPVMVGAEIYLPRQSFLKIKVQEEFKSLTAIELSIAKQNPKEMGKGFSSGINMDLGIAEWENAWNKIMHAPPAENWDSFQASYGSLAQKMQRQIVQNGRELNLFGNSDPINFTLLQPVIIDLIPAQVLIGEIGALTSYIEIQKTQERPLKIALLSRLMALKLNSKSAREQMIRLLNDYSHIFNVDYNKYEEMRSNCLQYYNLLENFIENVEFHKYKNSEEIGVLATQVLQSNENYRLSILNFVQERIESQQSYYKLIYWMNVYYFAFVSLLILIFLILRVITRHLANLYNHVQQMAQGNYGKCFCSGDNDEFGTVGRAFDEMSGSVQKVATELQEVSHKLADATVKIAEVTSEQEKIVMNREEGIKDIEKTTQKIANTTRELANMMQALNIHSLQESLADKAKDSLDSMQAKIAMLGNASESIVSLLEKVKEKMNGLGGLIDFMTKVSENANMLSLNAAIETATLVKHKESFAAISQKIQRFAQQTELSTEDIKKILEETNSNVTDVKSYAVTCLKEIGAGAEQLINFSLQLSRITRQGKEQLDQFKNFTNMMQDQASSAEMIIEFISELRRTAQDNTGMIQNLNQSLNELSVTANDLRNVLSLFRQGNKHEE